MWAGVDVGGRRKGFHAAVIDDERIVAGPARLVAPAEVVDWLRPYEPRAVAVDAPASPAPAGRLSREGECALARRVCGIRYTPDAARLAEPYYEWVLNGLELYAALARERWMVLECFPTASWTRWSGARGTRSRASWSADALASWALAGAPVRLGQDGRDALGAALTARAHARGETESFGEIVVPLPRDVTRYARAG